MTDKFNILDLEPEAFRQALEELDLPPEDFERLTSAYQDHNSPLKGVVDFAERLREQDPERGRTSTFLPISAASG